MQGVFKSLSEKTFKAKESETLVEFTINGDPKAQKRHRYRRTSNRIITYDPSSKDKEAIAKQMALSIPSTPFNEPLCLMIHFYMPRPKKHYRTGKFSNQLKHDAPDVHIGRPDIDNLIKLFMDVGNKLLWKDDSLICGVFAKKEYSRNPRTEVEIWMPHRD